MNAPVSVNFSGPHPLAQFLWLLARSLALALMAISLPLHFSSGQNSDSYGEYSWLI